MRQKVKIWLGVGIFTVLSLFWINNDFNLQNFKADFTGGTSSSTKSVFIPSNYASAQGETGQIELKAGTGFSMDDILGFQFELEWNAQHLTALEIVETGTVIENQDFLTDANLSNTGSVQVIAATGGSGVNIVAGNTFLKVAFKLGANVPLGTNIPIRINNFSIVQESGAILSETNLSTDDGAIVVSNTGSLKVVDATSLSDTSLEIEFSDYIAAADIADFTFTPNIKGGATLSVNDKKVVFTGLIPQSAGQEYRVDIAGTVLSNSEGAISTNHDFVYFSGYPAVASTFDIASVSNINAGGLTVNFTEEVADTFLNPINFQIATYNGATKQNLTVSGVSKTGNSLVLNTSVQSPEALYFLIVNPTVENTTGSKISSKNSIGFSGYNASTTRIISVNPVSLANNLAQTITINGENFVAGSTVKLADTALTVSNISSSTITATVPLGFAEGVYDLSVINPDGEKLTLNNALIVEKPSGVLTIVSDQSYASPYKVTNQNGATTLWVQVEDPLGVNDIEKVTADLRNFNASPTAAMTAGDIVNNKRWYFLELIVPPEVSTSDTPMTINITAENKSGDKATGTVSLLITRDLIASIAPTIESATVYPTSISPNEDTNVSFYVEASDADGADDIAKVILELGEIGLGTVVMHTVDDMYSSLDSMRSCNSSDYILGAWSDCGSDGLRSRTVELKSGVECDESVSAPPADEQNCDIPDCTTSDYEAGEWSTCTNGTQTRSYELKSGVVCTGTDSKPEDDTRSCATSALFDFFTPVAKAETLSGNSVWFEEIGLTVPAGLSPGVYQLPVTVVDKEGEEFSSTIALTVAVNDKDIPMIDKDDVYSVPHAGVPNDGTSSFVLNVKATDPNGANDIVGVTVNLHEIGLSPVALNRGATEGNGVWFSSDPLVIDRTINPGYRELTFTVTDKTGNYFTYDDFDFYVSDQYTIGDSPQVSSDRSYTSPSLATNDGETRMSLYTFIQEGDAEISSVAVNLENIARYAGSGGGSERIVELTPSAVEGANGQWYFISDIIIEESTKPALDPYEVSIVATDENGNTGTGIIEIMVYDESLESVSATTKPYVKNALAIDNRTVDILFSRNLDTKLLKSSVFHIIDYEDTKSVLPIRDIAVSADGRIVRLNTNFMAENTTYVVNVNGAALELGEDESQVEFEAFDASQYNTVPKLLKAKAISAAEVQLTFTQNLKYSSVKTDKFSANDDLQINNVNFGEDNNVLIVYTNSQVPNNDYYLYYDGLLNATGEKEISGKVSFQGYVSPDTTSLTAKSDFNSDGAVDFIDFTLFASVYGLLVDNGDGEAMDFNADGKVDFTDFTIFAEQFGKQTAAGETEEKTSEEVFDTYEPDDSTVPVFTD